jgi:hypothetical protein
MGPKHVKRMESKKVAKCPRNKAMAMAMELTDFINDTDPFMGHSLLFKTGMDHVLCPYKDIQKDL